MIGTVPCASKGNNEGDRFADALPLVSIIIPAYNEERHICSCLGGVLRQTYPHEKLEVLVVDGMSEDATRDIASQIAERHAFIHLLENPKRITSEAVNIGFGASSGQVIVVLGAHTVIAPEYVANAVSELGRADRRIGGVGPTLSHTGDGLFGNLVAHALSSPFGVGNARFRFSRKAEFVDTIAYGAYERHVFEKAGSWDTDLVRNQDIEFNHRVRKAGWRLLLTPDMECTYCCRTSLKEFISQNYANGYWNMLTFAQHPGTLSWRHFVPLAFVSGVLLAGIGTISLSSGWLLLAGITAAYCVGAVTASAVRSLAERRWALMLLLPTFVLLHTSYGVGSLAGLARLFCPRAWRRQRATETTAK